MRLFFSCQSKIHTLVDIIWTRLVDSQDFNVEGDGDNEDVALTDEFNYDDDDDANDDQDEAASSRNVPQVESTTVTTTTVAVPADHDANNDTEDNNEMDMDELKCIEAGRTADGIDTTDLQHMDAKLRNAYIKMRRYDRILQGLYDRERQVKQETAQLIAKNRRELDELRITSEHKESKLEAENTAHFLALTYYDVNLDDDDDDQESVVGWDKMPSTPVFKTQLPDDRHTPNNNNNNNNDVNLQEKNTPTATNTNTVTSAASTTLKKAPSSTNSNSKTTGKDKQHKNSMPTNNNRSRNNNNKSAEWPTAPTGDKNFIKRNIQASLKSLKII